MGVAAGAGQLILEIWNRRLLLFAQSCGLSQPSGGHCCFEVSQEIVAQSAFTVAHRTPFPSAIGVGLFFVSCLYSTAGIVASVHPCLLAVLGFLQVPTDVVHGEHVLARWHIEPSSGAHLVESTLLVFPEVGLPHSR